MAKEKQPWHSESIPARIQSVAGIGPRDTPQQGPATHAKENAPARGLAGASFFDFRCRLRKLAEMILLVVADVVAGVPVERLVLLGAHLLPLLRPDRREIDRLHGAAATGCRKSCSRHRRRCNASSRSSRRPRRRRPRRPRRREASHSCRRGRCRAARRRCRRRPRRRWQCRRRGTSRSRARTGRNRDRPAPTR